jgi:putative intracellular protease/amidase
MGDSDGVRDAVTRDAAAAWPTEKGHHRARSKKRAPRINVPVPFSFLPFSFLVEDVLKSLGGQYEKVPNWKSLAIVDGRLVTGQNPASSTAAAQALLKLITPSAA